MAEDEDGEQAAIRHKLLHGTFGKPQESLRESSRGSLVSDRDKQFVSMRDDRVAGSQQFVASNQKRPLHTTKKPLSGMAASRQFEVGKFGTPDQASGLRAPGASPVHDEEDEVAESDRDK